MSEIYSLHERRQNKSSLTTSPIVEQWEDPRHVSAEKPYNMTQKVLFSFLLWE
jgi:hypothetical protein